MPGRFLLDTSALVAHWRREPGWGQVQELFEEAETEILAASVTLTELARRVRELGATAAEARQTVAGYCELLDEIVPIDEATALTAFEIGIQTPERLPLTDSLIAAAARERGACLVHRDQHMLPIPSNLVEQRALSIEADSR